MLILTRKEDEKIKIGPDIEITIVGIKGKKVIVGIDAPKDVRISRDDIVNNEPKVRLGDA